MDTIPVVPVGSVIAPTAITDHGQQRRRQQQQEQPDEDHHDERKGADEVPPNGSMAATPTPAEKPPTRDDEGHIDCYG